MKHSFKLSLMTLMLSIPLAGCLHGGSSITATGANNPAADTTPPTVSTATPANNTTAVDILPTLSATFSEAMDATTINTATFTLTGPSGLVPATVNIDNSRTTATLTPLLSLAILTQYTGTITTGAKDSAGNPIAVDYTWNFTTRDRQWQTAARIENNTGNAAAIQLSNIVGDKVMAVWQQQNGAITSIYARRYTGAGGWGSVTLISDPAATTSAMNPQVVMDTNGNVIAVWQQSDGTRDHIWANRYTTNGGWGTVIQIENNTTSNASSPQIAMDTNGNAVAVWQLFDTIYAKQYNTGGSWNISAWSGETAISGTDFSMQPPQIAMNGNGDAVAVWRQSNGIYANRLPAGGSWGGTATAIPGVGASPSVPQIAIDTSGNAIAVWQQSNGIYYSRYASNAWSAAVTISGNATASNPQIAMNTNGNAVAVWEQFNGSTNDIWASQFTVNPGNSWSTPAQIQTGAGAALYPHVTINATGDAFAAWQQTNSIYANRFTYTSGTWSTAATAIGSNAGLDSDISMDNSGNAVAAWIQNNGVWSSRFE